MAWPNEVQVGRYNLLLHKLLAMEEGAPAPQLTGEIVPALIMENDRPEFKFLGQTQMWVAGARLVGVVGEMFETTLFNPDDSGLLCVVEYAEVSSDTAAFLELRDYTALPAGLTVGSAQQRDSRYTGFSGVSFNFGTSAALSGTRRGAAYRAAGIPFVPIQKGSEYVIAPGDGVGLTCGDVNVAAAVEFSYYIRALDRKELV